MYLEGRGRGRRFAEGKTKITLAYSQVVGKGGLEWKEQNNLAERDTAVSVLLKLK